MTEQLEPTRPSPHDRVRHALDAIGGRVADLGSEAAADALNEGAVRPEILIALEEAAALLTAYTQPLNTSIPIENGTEKQSKRPVLTRHEKREWLVRTSGDIANALKGRYGDNNTAKHQAIDTLLLASRTAFTPYQKDVVGSLLEEIGIKRHQSPGEFARNMIELPRKLHSFGLSDSQIRYIGKFLGLGVTGTPEELEISFLTQPIPIGRILEASKNGVRQDPLDVQVTINQALILLLRATKKL